MAKTIFITGASSGFGKAIAEKFGAEGWNCIITGRREDRLNELKIALEKNYAVKVLVMVFDVQNKNDVYEKINNLAHEWRNIDVVVNNAGLALGRDKFDVAEIDDWTTMIDTNIKGLLYVSKAILPYFKEYGKGHFVNIGSTAGKEVYEGGNVYCATKHSVDAISKAMRIDLLQYGIKVTAIHPGAAETEFSKIRFKGDVEKAAKVYANYEPLLAQDIADITFYCTNAPKHVCINDLVVTCTAQANSFYLKSN